MLGQHFGTLNFCDVVRIRAPHKVLEKNVFEDPAEILCAMFLVNDFHLLSGLFLSLASLRQVMGVKIIPPGDEARDCEYVDLPCESEEDIPMLEVTPANPIVPVGENLTLTCNLTNYFGPLNSSSLYFVSGRGDTNSSRILSQFYSVVSPTAIRLLIPFVKHKDEKFFRCFMNDTNQTYVASTRVQIGSPPEKITEIEVVSRNLVDLNVTWCTKNIGQDLSDMMLEEYHLNWTSWNWGVMEHCPNESKIDTQCYTCMWSSKGFFEGTYYLVITGSSIYGNSTSNFTINATEHVKPDPVANLEIEPLNSTSVNVMWKHPPVLTDRLGLNYTLTLMKKPQSPLKSVVAVGEYESVVLNDLHPGSIYTFGIRCIPEIGGVLSDETTIDFKMPDDVPATAPESPLGWFHSQWCLDGVTSVPCPPNNTCLSITFYWKSIPEDLRNGEILGYCLQSDDPNVSNHCFNENSTSAEVLLVVHKDHVLRLSAFTSAGHSVMHSILFLANCNEMPKPMELFAEQTSDKRGVVIQWNRVDGATNYSLLYCRGKHKSCSTLFCVSWAEQCRKQDNRCQLPIKQGWGETKLKMISSDQTNITLRNITEHIFALAVNTERGTSGLSWICLYDYDGPAFAPKVITMGAKTELTVCWYPVTCDDLPSSGERPGRVLNYTVTYGVTGTDKVDRLVVPGNTTQCILRDLIPGSNYTITVHGSTRTGKGKAVEKVFHLLNPDSSGGSQPVPIAAVIVPVVIATVLLLLIYCIWKRYRKNCLIPIKTPPKFDHHQSLQPEHQDNENYTTNVYTPSSTTLRDARLTPSDDHGRNHYKGYAVVSTDPAQRLQGYKSGKRGSIDYKQHVQDTELTLMLDVNQNVSPPCLEAKNCSYQSGKSATTSTPMDESKGSTDVESLLCDSSVSVDPYYESSEMGYASANMASQGVPPGPPQPVNYDSCFNDSSASQSVGPVKQEQENNMMDDILYDVRRVIKAQSPSAVSMTTDEHSASGDYSKASYAI